MSTSLDLIYDSSTIYAQGLLQGASLQIDPTSLLPLSHDGQVLRGRLRSSLSKQHAHGGEMGWVCIKKVEEGSGRAPRNVKREIELLQSMRHDNVSAASSSLPCSCSLILEFIRSFLCSAPTSFGLHPTCLRSPITF